MFIGSDEDIMGLPEESKGISTPVEHSFDFDIEKEGGTNFTPTEPKKKREMKIVVKEKNNGRRKQKPGKSSNLF